MEPIIIEEQPLSVREEKRLAELEAIIEQNFKGFVAVGMALAEIRDQRLYRSSHNTFEDYCRELWEMARQHADRLIASAKVIENLTPIGVKNEENFPEQDFTLLPSNEAQARELTRLEPEEQRLVWQYLIEQSRAKHQDGKPAKITALSVRKAVLSLKGKKLETKIDGTTKDTRQNRTEFQSEEFTDSFENFLRQIDEERHRNWRYTSRQTVFNHLLTLTELVGKAGPKEMEIQGCALELSDREKLRKAGFKIFRMDISKILIEQWSRNDEWAVHSSHETLKDLSDSFKELMLDPSHLKG